MSRTKICILGEHEMRQEDKSRTVMPAIGADDPGCLAQSGSSLPLMFRLGSEEADGPHREATARLDVVG